MGLRTPVPYGPLAFGQEDDFAFPMHSRIYRPIHLSARNIYSDLDHAFFKDCDSEYIIGNFRLINVKNIRIATRNSTETYHTFVMKRQILTKNSHSIKRKFQQLTFNY